MNETNQKRAVIYVRVSTKEQVDEGNSLSTQEKICKDYCFKNEYDIVQIFVEQGESAKTADRTELQKLLAFCADKKNQVKAVMIYKLDRLSRNTDDYSQLRLLLTRYGVEIKSVSEHFENTPVGRFMENTLSNISQFDNDIRSERCAGGMKEAMRDGRYVWMATVGYENVKIANKATIAQSKMAPLIRKTFELIALNTYPTEEVRRIMTKEGLLNKSGKPFSKSYFYSMLTNELFAGWIVKFGERHKGNFEPIVSGELFNQVQRVLKTRGRKHSAYLTDNPDFPLRKFIKSDEGKVLTGSWSTSGNGKRYAFYRFGNDKSSMNRDAFQEDFKKYMDKYSLNEKHYQKLKILVRNHLTKATSEQRKQVEQLKRRIYELNEKQSAIIKKNLEGVISDTVLKQQLQLIENQVTETSVSLANIPNSDTDYDKAIELMEEYLKQPSKVWAKAKVGIQIKLEWFQFPLGLVFKNKIFGTSEVASVFKVKDAISASLNSKVDRTGLEPATPSLQMRCSTR